MTMNPKELKAEIERLDRRIDHARGIFDDPDHRSEAAPVVEQWAKKLGQFENELQELLAGLTPEDRMFLRDEITREIELQFVISQTADLESKRKEADEAIIRLRQRWDRISKFGGVVPTQVNGRDLLDEITRTFLNFVMVSKEEAQILTLWAVHTNVMDYQVFYHTPRLLVWSEQAESGKSTLKDVLMQLVPNPLSSGGITGDALLALLKDHNSSRPGLVGHWTSVGGPADVKKPTLLIDEADNVMQTQKLRRILNTGHSWCGTIQEKNRRTGLMEEINTFASLALFEIDDTERRSGSMRSYRPLKTRSIEIELKQALKDPEHDADPSDELFNSLSMELRPKIETWVETKNDDIRETYSDLKKRIKKEEIAKIISPRARNNWVTLIAIADVAGGHWPQTVRELCIRFAPHRARSPEMKAPDMDNEVHGGEAVPSSPPTYLPIGAKVNAAKTRIISAIRQRSPQSKVELRMAGCKNFPGSVFDQAIQELLADGQVVFMGKASSGGRPKDMYGVANVH